MCDPGVETACNTSCAKDFTDYPMCETQLIAYYECLGDEVPTASCSCGPTDTLQCTGICASEFDAASTCATM